MITLSLIIANKDVCKVFHTDGTKSSSASVASGTFKQCKVNNLQMFNKALGTAKSRTAITTGIFPIEEGILGTVATEDIAKGIYARTQDNVTYLDEGKYLILLDNDPHPDGRSFTSADEYLKYVKNLHPVLSELEILVRPSSSAGVRVNGELRQPLNGWHCYITADAGVPVHRVRDWLEHLSWEHGDGYIMLSKIGAMFNRCTFDLAVFSPERLIFIAPPRLEEGVTRDEIASAYQTGRSLSKDDDLTSSVDVNQLQRTARQEPALLAKQKVITEHYVKEKSQYLAKLTGKPVKECKAALKKSLSKEGGFFYLPDYFEVTKANGKKVTLKGLLDAGKDVTLCDPVEGVEYGRTTAKYYHNQGKPVINSMAHGGIQYRIAGVQYETEVKEFWQDYGMNAEGRYVNLNLPKGQPYSQTAFNNKHANEPCLQVKDCKNILPSVYAMGRLPTLDGRVYHPLMSGRVLTLSGMTVFNTYKQYQHVPITEPCNTAERLIKEHLKHLFDDEREQGLMLDWMAHQVQKPGQLLRFAPLIVGIQGDGKTTISNIVIAAIGSDNAVTAINSNLESEFNGWANDAALCCIEELKSAGKDKHRIYNELKPFITNQFISINRKGINQITVDNVTNYFACSNHKDALPLEQGDRRWWVMFTKFVDVAQFDGVKHAGYFDQLYAFINDPVGAAKVYEYLSQHDISTEFSNARSAPVSASKTLMHIAGYGDDELALKERLEHYGNGIECVYRGETCINVTKMQAWDKSNQQSGFVTWDNPVLPIGTRLKTAMNSLGYVSMGRTLVGANKDKCTLYKLKV